MTASTTAPAAAALLGLALAIDTAGRGQLAAVVLAALIAVVVAQHGRLIEACIRSEKVSLVDGLRGQAGRLGGLFLVVPGFHRDCSRLGFHNCNRGLRLQPALPGRRWGVGRELALAGRR